MPENIFFLLMKPFSHVCRIRGREIPICVKIYGIVFYNKRRR
jgi:hypothetical protein